MTVKNHFDCFTWKVTVHFMIFLFLCNKVFVPFNLPILNKVPRATVFELDKQIEIYEHVVVFIGSQNDPDIELFHTIFFDASQFFARNGTFLYVTAKEGQKYLDKYKNVDPALLIFKDHKIWLSTAFPKSGSELFYILYQFFKQKVTYINSIPDLMKGLSHFPLTIICSQELLQEAFVVRYQIAVALGFIDIIVTSNEFLENGLNVPSDKIGVFRMEDKCIVPVYPTFYGLFEGVRPYYRKFVEEDFEEPNATFCAYLGNKMTPLVETILYEFAIKYPKLTFGFVPPEFHDKVRDATLLPLKNIPTFIVFSYQDRSFYPQNFEEFDEKRPTKIIKQYIDSISDNSIKRKYHTEAVPKDDPKDLVKKLVGLTYQDFLNDTKHDLVVLYTEPHSEDCEEALIEFTQAAEAMKRTGVRFAYIDSYLNSCPLKFPFFLSKPSLRIYPAINRSNDMMFLHHFTKNNIILFVNQFGSWNYDIKTDPRDKNQFKLEMSQFAHNAQYIPKGDRDKLEPYFYQLWVEMGLEEKHQKMKQKQQQQKEL